MDKEQIKSLMDEAWKTIANVQHTVRTLTAENPLILFDKDKADAETDDLYDLPYGYYVDKYENYNQGAIQRVCGDEVTIFLTGERFGETWELSLTELPIESQIDLLTYLTDRI
jgi:hypothetical protein